ncbi:hypothetical protein [Halodesulfovibrio aestuarii]|uniref:Uncharacterized protein n=1 Tax=Halodesulfovibrio aestuarii TaxID=126333 RepID=A0ABV4JPW5_9BACT
MKRYYDPESGGFYLSTVHQEIPQRAVPITLEEHSALVRALEQGKVIQLDENGHPIAVEPPALPEPTEQELTQQRIIEIQQLLTANDSASVRPLRAKAAGTATDADKARLVELETQAQALRSELVALTNPESFEDQSQPEQSFTKQSFLKKCNWLRMGKN